MATSGNLGINKPQQYSDQVSYRSKDQVALIRIKHCPARLQWPITTAWRNFRHRSGFLSGRHGGPCAGAGRVQSLAAEVPPVDA